MIAGGRISRKDRIFGRMPECPSEYSAVISNILDKKPSTIMGYANTRLVMRNTRAQLWFSECKFCIVTYFLSVNKRLEMLSVDPYEMICSMTVREGGFRHAYCTSPVDYT